MLLGLSSRYSDNLPVYINGYTPIDPFRKNTSIRFQLLSYFNCYNHHRYRTHFLSSNREIMSFYPFISD